MTDRSTLAEVRNPILSLPASAALRDLNDESKSALISVMLNLQADARERAEKCWRTHKAPMAVYWKAVGVYAGHIARALRSTSAQREPVEVAA